MTMTAMTTTLQKRVAVANVPNFIIKKRSATDDDILTRVHVSTNVRCTTCLIQVERDPSLLLHL